MTYKQAEQKGELLLQEAGVMDAKIDAWLLLEMVAKIDRSFYFTHINEDVEPEVLTEYERVLEKRAEHVPLQYITGEQWFMGYRFEVNENVLIPRQDTELLVEKTADIIKNVYGGSKLADVNTSKVEVLGGMIENVYGGSHLNGNVTNSSVLVDSTKNVVNDVYLDIYNSIEYLNHFLCQRW